MPIQNRTGSLPPARRQAFQRLQVIGRILVNVIVQPVFIQQVGVGPPAEQRRLGRVVPRVVIAGGRNIQPLVPVTPVFGIQGVLVVLRVSGDKDLSPVLDAQQVRACRIALRQDAQLSAGIDVLPADPGMAAVGA